MIVINVFMKLLAKFSFFLLICTQTSLLKSQVFFSENFEGQLNNTTSLPTAWSKKGFSNDKIFQVGDSSSSVFKVNGEVLWSVPSHTKFAYTSDIACSYLLGGQNCNKTADRLILPAQDFRSISESVLLSFDSYFQGKLGSFASIEYSIDQGINWIHIYDIVPNSKWKNNYLDVTFLNKFASVLIAFRFNDNNALRDGLAIDNVQLKKVNPWIDLKIISSDLTKYTSIPSTQLVPLPLNCVFTNIGSKDAENSIFSLKIFNKSTPKKLLKEYNKTYVNIKQKDTVKVDFGTMFSNQLTDSFQFEFNISNNIDTSILNNSLLFDAIVSLNEYARDDNQYVGVLGLSSSNTITLGNVYEINRASYIDSVSVFLEKKNMAIGSNIQVVVYPIINKIPVLNPIGYSAVYTINSLDTVSKLVLKVTDNFLSRLKLDSGNYLVAINKFTNGSSLAVKMTNKYFSENAVFVKIGDANFQTLDTYFSGSYKLVPSIRMYCSPFCNLNIKIKENKADCQSGIGSLSVVPVNGSYPYKYTWSNATKDSVLSNIKVGKYGISISDKFNCKFDSSNINLNFNTPPRITVDSISHVKCFGSNDGYVSLKIVDNNKLKKIFWNTFQTNTVYNASLSAGMYVVKVFNDVNCVDSIQVEISTPDSLKIGSTFTNETPKAKGEIYLFVSGGVAPYSFIWNDSIFTKNRNELEGGKTYVVDIKDFNGCVRSKMFTLQKIVSLSELSNTTQLEIYPNPSTGEFFITGEDEIEVIIENLEGNFIAKNRLNESTRMINLSEYNKGVYLIRIIGKNYSLIRKISII